MATFPCKSPASLCDQQTNPLTTYSAEAQDGPTYIGLAWSPQVPLLNKAFTSYPCEAITESQSSQEDADLSAARGAVECTNPCSTVFSNTEQTASAQCANGFSYFYTVSSGQFAALDQVSADREAFTFAAAKLPANSVCIGDITTTEMCKDMPYSATIFAVVGGNQPVSFSIVSGSLPAGLAMSVEGTQVTIAGTPTEFGTFTFTIEARTAAGTYTRRGFILGVGGITTPAGQLPEAFSGSAYSQTIAATSITGIQTFWSIQSGSLPPGFTINSTTGEISGTTTSNGTYSFVVAAVMGEAICLRQYAISTSLVNWGAVVWTNVLVVVGGGVGGVGVGTFSGAQFAVSGKGDGAPSAKVEALGTVTYTGPAANCKVTVTVTDQGTSAAGFFVNQDGVQRLLVNAASLTVGVHEFTFSLIAGTNSVIEIKGLTDILDPARCFVFVSDGVIWTFNGTFANA